MSDGEKAPNSWKPEVQTDDSGKWYHNDLAFESREAAETWVRGLMVRWTLVRQVRVVPSDEEANR